MVFKDIYAIANTHPQVVKTSGHFTAVEVSKGLATQGLFLGDRSVRRIMGQLGICRTHQGWYTAADVAVLTGWVLRRSQYRTIRDYKIAEGAGVYARAAALLQN